MPLDGDAALFAKDAWGQLRAAQLFVRDEDGIRRRGVAPTALG
ncbi:hypothetical protein NPS70_16590 [Streptomyces sp. C10-9-1]|nr:hypothetical protein [Streptomyces sp. C10-9-1]MCQ6554805.1 hypothetical protein [Streptomyces sp. C10-9-1]